MKAFGLVLVLALAAFGCDSGSGGNGGSAGAGGGGGAGPTGACLGTDDQDFACNEDIQGTLTQCGLCSGLGVGCPNDCAGNPVAPSTSVDECANATMGSSCDPSLTDDCLGCYKDVTQCGTISCAIPCFAGAASCACLDCVATACDEAFEACAGYSQGTADSGTEGAPAGDGEAGGPPSCEGLIYCEGGRGGAGGAGGTGGAGGAGGAGGGTGGAGGAGGAGGVGGQGGAGGAGDLCLGQPAGTPCGTDGQCTSDDPSACRAGACMDQGAGSNSEFICSGANIKGALTQCGVCEALGFGCPNDCSGDAIPPNTPSATCVANTLLVGGDGGACTTGMDAACLDCYNEASTCGTSSCTPSCSNLAAGAIDGPNGCDCIDCVNTSCDLAFDACAGFPQGLPTGTPNPHPGAIGGPPICEAIPTPACANACGPGTANPDCT